LTRKVNKEKEAKKIKKESDIVTKESFCATGGLFSLLAVLMLCSGGFIFGGVGLAVRAFLTGSFGYIAFPLFMGTLYLSITGLIGKRLIKNRKAATMVVLSLLSVALIVHTAITYSWSLEGYISKCFFAGEEFPAATITGGLGAIIIFLVASLLSKVGTIVLFSALCVFFAYVAYVYFKKGVANVSTLKEEKTKSAQSTPIFEIPLSQPTQTPTQQQPAPQFFMQQQTPSYQPNNPMGQNIEIAQPKNIYGGMQTPEVQQRPGFILSQSGTQEKKDVSGGFSPFGAAGAQEEKVPDITPQNSREFLFGSSPQENYKRNLIFDPNANVNKRQSFEPNLQDSFNNGYTPSYSDAYQKSLNDDVGNRPAKIVTDNTYNYGGNMANVQDDTRPLSGFEPPKPTPPVETIPTFTQEQTPSMVEPPVSYSTFNESAPSSREPELQVDEPSAPQERTPYSRHDYMDLFSTSNPNLFGGNEEQTRKPMETFDRESERSGFDTITDRGRRLDENNDDRSSSRDGLNLFDEEESEDPYTLRSDFDPPKTDRNTDRMNDNFIPPTREARSEELPTIEELPDRGRVVEEMPPVMETRPIEPPKPTPPPPPKPRVIRPYVRVPLDDFDCRDNDPTSNPDEVEQTKQDIISTLEDFKVTGATIASVTFGPTVTRYNVTIPRGISPMKVVGLSESISISLHAQGVNVYPNYEDGVVSIEVPNRERQFVRLGCMLSADTFVNAKSSSLMFAMGKDVANRKVYGDISKMIHMLVAGSSGSGKSVFLGSLIISLIYKYSPEELRLILIDPKKTEFVLYNDLPHLMINEIITDVNKAIQSLNWAIGEMNRRYGLFEQMSRSGTYVVNLDQYNAQVEKAEKLPKIVIIIDELADLMLAAKKDLEDRIQNLTQKARAAGIHLIVATQRPSKEVITGVIKSNLATRVAFAVPSEVDSRVILDQMGAQNLIGKGDFLYTMQGINTPVRVQSAFISPEESQKIVNFIKSNNEAYYDEEATAFINKTGGPAGDATVGGMDKESLEPVYIEALRYVILSGSASISMIQRKCSAGYNKAGKIIEWMEDKGYISAFDGAKARKVLISKEQFESEYGPL